MFQKVSHLPGFYIFCILNLKLLLISPNCQTLFPNYLNLENNYLNISYYQVFIERGDRNIWKTWLIKISYYFEFSISRAYITFG